MEPRHRDRPDMPGYGIDAGPAGLLPWSWAEERLVASRCYWVATSAGGRPQVMPVWGVWLDGAVWFSSSPGAHRTRNLAADPRCTVATEDPHQPVVLDGRADRVDDDGAIARFASASDAKYGTSYGAEFYRGNATFRVAPGKVVALDDGSFASSPTRWRF